MDGMIVLTGVTAIFTAIAAAASAWSVVRMRHALEAGTLVTLAQAYASDDMNDAIHCILKWREQYPENFADKYIELRMTPEGRKVDTARRRFSHHVVLVYNLIRVGGWSISRKFARALIPKQTTQLYLELIEPMEAVIDPKPYDRASFDYLARLHRIDRLT